MAPPPAGAEARWTRIQGGSGVDTLRSVAAVAPDTYYIAYATGILRFQNQQMTGESVPSLPGALRAVWGSSPTRAFAVGTHGTALRRDGSGWTLMSTPGGADLADVFGTAGVVFAVGSKAPASGCIWSYDGTAWSVMSDTLPAPARAVWAAGAGDVFVAGDGGFVSHFDGAAWSSMTTPASDDLLAVWGASSRDVYAVGAGGRILHDDGTGWVIVPTGTTATLRSVWGSSSRDVRVVGDGGFIRLFDGTGWAPPTTHVTSSLYSVAGVSGSEALCVGDLGTVLGVYGPTWMLLERGLPYAFDGVWSSGSYFVAVGGFGTTGVATDGSRTWVLPHRLHGVTSFRPGDTYAVGDAGDIEHFDGDSWSPETPLTGANLRAITALVNRFGDPYRMYAVGDAGTLRVWRGGQWLSATPPAGAEAFDFVDVWAAALDDVFAVASNSNAIVRYDDPTEQGGWTLESTPATGALVGVGGWEIDTYAVSDRGEIIHHDGNQWTLMKNPAQTALRDVRGTAGHAAVAVGDDGVALLLDAGVWHRMDTGFLGRLSGVHGRADTAVFAVGAQGAVIEYQP